jgi:hypothetical protein
MIRTGLLVLLFAAAGFLSAQNAGDVLAISVREGEIRSAPGFLSTIESRAGYGETVRVVTRQGAWIRVRVEQTGIDGWIHQSSVLPPRDMNLTGASARESGATSREVALAGRGFNEQIEQEYREQHELDYESVDVMETYLMPLSALAAFLNDIGVDVPDGGPR